MALPHSLSLPQFSECSEFMSGCLYGSCILSAGFILNVNCEARNASIFHGFEQTLPVSLQCLQWAPSLPQLSETFRYFLEITKINSCSLWLNIWRILGNITRFYKSCWPKLLRSRFSLNGWMSGLFSSPRLLNSSPCYSCLFSKLESFVEMWIMPQFSSLEIASCSSRKTEFRVITSH